MDREAVAVRVECQALEVDGHALDLVVPGAEAVRPRGEQGQAGDVARPVAVEAARECEQLVAAVADRDAEHPELGEEGRIELAGGHGHAAHARYRHDRHLA